MTDLNTSTAHNRTITAFFDTRQAAERAVEDLTAMGLSRDQVRITEGDATSSQDATGQAPAKGFWEELKSLFLPEEDHHSYAEGLRRGGYLLSAQVGESHYDQAMEVLDTDGAVNMDEREEDWRSTGWGAQQPSAMGGSATALGASDVAPARLDTWGTEPAASAEARPRMAPPVEHDGGPVDRPIGAEGKAGMAPPVERDAGLTERTGMTAGATPASENFSAKTARSDAGQDEVIPLYEEKANVAKRDVNHGRVRLRSYVVETPFSEQVNLRSEQVQVERRPVDRPVGAGGAVFQDRVIEAEEHGEEAIVGKETRVREEVALRKTVENQSQTVSENLRRTEVEVQDERNSGQLGAAAFTGDTSRIADGMDVIASDGSKIGTVDHLDGDRIKLKKTTSPDGQHHYVPLAWIDHVDAHVHLNKAVAEAKAGW